MVENKKYKICYLINCLIHAGAQSVLINLLENIDREKYQPVVISLEARVPLADRIKELKIPVYSANVSSKYDIKAAWKLYKLLKNINPDILHTHLFHSDITGRIFGKACGIPVIINTVHNIKFGNRLRDFINKKSDFMSDYTVTICQAATDVMVKKKLVSPDKIKVIYNGIDPDKYFINKSASVKERITAELGLAADKNLAISIGRLRYVKGFSYLLQALKLIEEELANWHFLIVGDGELRSQLEEEAYNLGLSDYVSFPGVRDDIPQLLAASEFLVLSSLWEGLPLVIEEGMAAELPVIATKVGGVPELVEEGKTGYLVDPADSRQLAEALEKIMSIPVIERKQMGKKGRTRVEKLFNIKKMTADYEGVYSTFMENNTK